MSLSVCRGLGLAKRANYLNWFCSVTSAAHRASIHHNVHHDLQITWKLLLPLTVSNSTQAVQSGRAGDCRLAGAVPALMLSRVPGGSRAALGEASALQLNSTELSKHSLVTVRKEEVGHNQ